LITTREPRQIRSPPLHGTLSNQFADFWNKWVKTVEPPLFVARALLHDTPLDEAVNAISKDVRNLNNTIMPALMTSVAEEGRRPDTKPLDAAWKQLMTRRQVHLDLAQEHFSLTLAKVERAALRQRRQS